MLISRQSPQKISICRHKIILFLNMHRGKNQHRQCNWNPTADRRDIWDIISERYATPISGNCGDFELFSSFISNPIWPSLFVNFTAISLNITSHMQHNIQNQLMKQLETHSRHIYEPHRLYMACDLISCHNKNFKTSELFSRRIIYFRADDEFFFQAENK